MLQLQMDLAVQEQRYEDAVGFKTRLTDLKLHSQPLRLVRAVCVCVCVCVYVRCLAMRCVWCVLCVCVCICVYLRCVAVRCV